MGWYLKYNLTEDDYHQLVADKYTYKSGIVEAIRLFDQLACADSEVVRSHAEKSIRFLNEYIEGDLEG